MKISNNIDFFNQDQVPATHLVTEHKQEEKPVEMSAQNHAVKFSDYAEALIEKTKTTLQEIGLNALTEAVDRIEKDATKERFVISVVGEFSRGKSTFLNRLLDNAPMLPVGNLPTTAILTRIRYSAKPRIAVFDEKGNRQFVKDLRPEVWEGLTVNVAGGNEPKGVAFVGVRNNWMCSNNVEFIDCPGAGDLSEERVKQIGDALNRTDGAVIAVSALAALSMSERLFIQQRIINRKTPFTMLIVNRLDEVKLEERNRVIKHIIDKLALYKFDIQVFVPYEVEMPDDTYSSIIGIDKVKTEMESWIYNPRRQELTELWLLGRIGEVVTMAVNIMKEQQVLLGQDEEKRRDKIAEQRLALDRLALEWGDYSLKLQTRGNKCYELFLDKVEEFQANIIEKLQYEAAHASDPKRWWHDDYPYRLKMELANMSVGLEQVVVRQATQDARWFNTVIEQKFKALIQVGDLSVAEKSDFINSISERDIKFESINKKANIARIGTAALSIAGFFVLGPGMGILATMGIGTGGAILSSTFVKKKLEQQRNEMKKALAQDIPVVVMKAIANSEQRVRALYHEMLRDNQAKMNEWVEAQKQAIELANSSDITTQKSKVTENITKLTELSNQLNK